MKIKNFLIGVICCAILVPCVAFAINKSREVAEFEKNRRVMFDYAKCVVRQRHARAAEAILSNADDEVIKKRYAELIIPDCLVRVVGGAAEMKFGGDLYRYALADALVNSDYATTSESDFSNRLPLAHIVAPKKSDLDVFLAANKKKRIRERAQAAFVEQTGVSWLSQFGECVVRQDPTKARLWLLTPTDAPEETDRINDLQSAFSACLAQGSLTFNRISMRGTVALNYYRLAKAAIQPVAGENK
jgi:hypothetical protein